MKKRGGKPNSHTFTILLMGCRAAGRDENFTPVRMAEETYLSINEPNSGVELDLIHTNAMLTVCQWHGDLDTLWRIAGEMPEAGPLAPDMTTYTIVLAGVLHQCRADIKLLESYEEIFDRKVQMLKEGRRVWSDIIHRWKNDKVPLDKRVVFAMARLLLEGPTDQCSQDVFMLYNQTMGIPIMAEKPKERMREFWIYKLMKKHPYLSELDVARRRRFTAASTDAIPLVDINNRPLPEAKEDTTSVEEENEEENLNSVFDPIDVEAENLTLLKPDAKDLGVIVDACCRRTEDSTAGIDYWELLTSQSGEYRVIPDNIAASMYLRVLRLNRSSKRCVALLRDQMLPLGQAEGKAFHIALTTCRRDINNKWSLQNANELMDLLQKVPRLPDVRAVRSYLILCQALAQKPECLLNLEGITENDDTSRPVTDQFNTRLQAKLRFMAYKTIRPHFLQLHEAMIYGTRVRGRWATVHDKIEPILAKDLVPLMAWIRLFIDEALAAEYQPFIPKADLEDMKSDALMMRGYSDKSFLDENLSKGNGWVYPSPAQRTAFVALKLL